MAGPWEAFQDTVGSQLAQNDAAIVAPPRAAVPSSKRVWGDAEAQSAGLYDPPKSSGGPWNAFRQAPQEQQSQPQSGRAPLRITVSKAPSSEVASRFDQMQPPQSGGDNLQYSLNQQTLGRDGPEASPASQMAVDLGNQVAAASQGTTPHIGNYGGKLVSKETFEDDGGNVLYRDPLTKKVVPTNNQTQVALRDPADGVVKVFERSDSTNENPAVGVSRVLAPGLASGAVTARPGIAATKGIIPRASDIFSTAKAPYREFDRIAANTPVAADEAQNMVGRIHGALDAAHLPSEVAKQVHDTVALLSKKGDTALSQLQYVKRAVGKLFQSPEKNIRDAAGVATKEIVRIISEVSPQAGKSLKTADDIHSTARSVQDLQRKREIAGLRTGRAGYGGNAVNNMRTSVEKIVEAHINGRTTGFKPNEIQAMTDIVNGQGGTNALRNIGAMAPSKGIAAIAVGGVTGGASAVAGSVANKLATVLTGKQLERLNELVAKRSPAYEAAVAKAVDRFEKAQIELGNNPTPAKFTAYVSASRSLASGLNKDGIAITSGDLIRQLTGPIKTAADEQQQPVQGPPGQ